MTRGIVWRRYMKEKHTKRRLKNYINSSYFIYDVNNNAYYDSGRYIDLLNTNIYFVLKGCVSTRHDSKYKNKYSKNKSKRRYFLKEGNGKTRIEQKEIFRKILKENNII